MVVIDHYEQDMFKVSNHQVMTNFNNSVIGRALSNQILGHPRSGIDTKGIDTNLQFFYKDEVPKQNYYTKQWQKPRASILKKSLNDLLLKIKEYQPDIIVSYGSWFANELVKEYKLDKSNIEPVHWQTEDFDTYISFCPSPKLFSYMGPVERDRLKIENRMINRFLAGGVENLKPQLGKYELVKDFDKAKEILTKTVYDYPIVAVDFETNTLETYRKGAKAIMISLSWKEHQGVSIPLDHRLEPDLWTKEQFNQIIGWIKKLISSDQWKVFHNGMYDIHMLMDIYGLEQSVNCVDTLLMYYQLVDESQGAPRGLKHLAYLYTDMGGYEDPRDEAFAKYLDDYYDKWLAEEMEKYKKGERKTKPSHKNYTAPTNPVDGAKIDFEWLPMETIYTYAAADTDVTLQIYDQLKKLVGKRPKWHKLIYEFYPQLQDTLAYMQHTGFQVDRSLFDKYKEHFTKDMKDLVQKMYDSVPEIREYEKHRLAQVQKREKIKEIKPKDRTPEQQKFFKDIAKICGKDPNTGEPKYKFNPGSGEKIAYVLYEMMGYQLPAEKDYVKPKVVKERKLSHPERLTWKDYKTDRNSALPYLAKEYKEPLADMLLQYSSDKKMISGVIDGYGKLLDPNNRLHSTFRIYGTATSRLASSNPLAI